MKKNNIVLCFIVFGLLTACEQFKSGLGLDHYQPDEFSVPTNPPLELPPNYKLRPPRTADGKESSIHVKDQDPADKAQQVIGVKKKNAPKSEEKTSKNKDDAESSIINKAKAASNSSENSSKGEAHS